jgi:HD-GYP domain-containing protein (c-di-GMP phosphodiesterase class II)
MTGGEQVFDSDLRELGTEFNRLATGFLDKLGVRDRHAGHWIHDKAGDLFSWFQGFPQPLRLLAQLRSHHPDSYSHSVNVCLLTAIQVEQANLPEEVREAALAGLLHDVGKVSVPAAVLDKKEALSRTEAARISVHCVAGARSLATMPDLPRLVVVGAWEHHLHHDGTGGYPRPTRCRSPHPVSQMISLADFFDSLTTWKPYRPEQPRDRVLQMMREREGRVFHPELLQGFTALIESLN